MERPLGIGLAKKWLLLVDKIAAKYILWEKVNMNEKRTMTLNLTSPEMAALETLAHKKELSKTALIRQALRLYHLVDVRLSQGEKLVFEDELQKKKAEIMVL